MVEIRENELVKAVVLSWKIPEFKNPYGQEEYTNRLGNKNNLILTAYIQNKPVGFKIGYELNDTTFYSWMGGVLPEVRNAGIASSLLQYQEKWCQGQGFEKIRVKTRVKHEAMTNFLNKNGYKEFDREEDADPGEVRVFYEKYILEDQ